MSPVAIIVVSLIVIGVLSYFVLMIFFPEWVGITGKSAHRVNDQHVEGSESKDVDFINK